MLFKLSNWLTSFSFCAYFNGDNNDCVQNIKTLMLGNRHIKHELQPIEKAKVSSLMRL